MKWLQKDEFFMLITQNGTPTVEYASLKDVIYIAPP
jgi:hypothetical protein